MLKNINMFNLFIPMASAFYTNSKISGSLHKNIQEEISIKILYEIEKYFNLKRKRAKFHSQV